MEGLCSNLLTFIPYLNDKDDKEKLGTRLKLTYNQWGKHTAPNTTTNLYVDDKGLHVTFYVEEKDPRATFTEHMSRVCEDSAVELFLCLPPKEHAKDTGFKPHLNEHMYINIEINSKGACYAKYGQYRKDRIAFSAKDLASLEIKPTVNQDNWQISFVVPHELIDRICSYNVFEVDNVVAFNLYKISESENIEHYLSFSKIYSEAPNFHLPDYFAIALIKKY